MKTKDIFDVFGIAPSTLSDWSKEDNKKHTLAQLLKNMSMDDVKDILSKLKQYWLHYEKYRVYKRTLC